MGYGREERRRRRREMKGWRERMMGRDGHISQVNGEKSPASTKRTEPANKSAKSTLYNSKSTSNNCACKARENVNGRLFRTSAIIHVDLGRNCRQVSCELRCKC